MIISTETRKPVTSPIWHIRSTLSFKSFSPTLLSRRTMKQIMTLMTILMITMKMKLIEFWRVLLQVNLHPYHPFGLSSIRSMLSPSQFVVAYKVGTISKSVRLVQDELYDHSLRYYCLLEFDLSNATSSGLSM